MSEYAYVCNIKKPIDDRLALIGVHLSHDCSYIYTVYTDCINIIIRKCGTSTLKSIEEKQLENIRSAYKSSMNIQCDALAIHTMHGIYIYNLITYKLVDLNKIPDSSCVLSTSLEYYLRNENKYIPSPQ